MTSRLPVPAKTIALTCARDSIARSPSGRHWTATETTCRRAYLLSTRRLLRGSLARLFDGQASPGLVWCCNAHSGHSWAPAVELVIAPPFRVGVTRDLLLPDGAGPVADIGLGLLDSGGIEWAFLGQDVDELRPQLIDGFDAIFVGGPRVTARSIAGSERLALMARFGVGYEKIDVDACTQAGILVTITPEAVRRPVAVAALTLLLSLTQNLRSLDYLMRDGRWHERANFLGIGLVVRTVGAVGLGMIGPELF